MNCNRGIVDAFVRKPLKATTLVRINQKIAEIRTSLRLVSQSVLITNSVIVSSRGSGLGMAQIKVPSVIMIHAVMAKRLTRRYMPALTLRHKSLSMA